MGCKSDGFTWLTITKTALSELLQRKRYRAHLGNVPEEWWVLDVGAVVVPGVEDRGRGGKGAPRVAPPTSHARVTLIRHKNVTYFFW